MWSAANQAIVQQGLLAVVRPWTSMSAASHALQHLVEPHSNLLLAISVSAQQLNIRKAAAEGRPSVPNQHALLFSSR